MPRSIARRRSMADPFAQRWSVWAAGFGGSQTTDGNTALGSNNTTSRIAWRRGRRRLSVLAVHAGRLCAGRRRHQLQRCQRSWHRPLRPVSGRRLRPAQRRPGLSLRRAGLWLAGHHHRSHRHGRRHRSVARAVQRQCMVRAASKAAIVLSARGSAIGITPYAAGQFTTFDLPAYAEQAVSRRQHLCARLRLKERHGLAQRTRLAQR